MTMMPPLQPNALLGKMQLAGSPSAPAENVSGGASGTPFAASPSLALGQDVKKSKQPGASAKTANSTVPTPQQASSLSGQAPKQDEFTRVTPKSEASQPEGADRLPVSVPGETSLPAASATPLNVSEGMTLASAAKKETATSEEVSKKPSPLARSGMFHSFLEARSAQRDASQKSVATTGKTTQTEDVAASSSKLVALYKLSFAVTGASFINSFLFGSPLGVSVALALAFASAQSLLALKICKEDTAISRKMLAISRKLTGNENAKTQSDKERAMAPVWGAVSSSLALIEACLNIAARKSPWLKQKLQFSDKTFPELQAQLNAELSKGALGGYQKAQLACINTILSAKQKLGNLKTTVVASLPEALRGSATSTAEQKGIQRLFSKFVQNITHPKYSDLRGIAWAMGSAFIGGYFQSVWAAKLHQKVEDARQQPTTSQFR